MNLYTDFEKQLEEDLPHIIHIITAPPAKNDSEAEWERILQLDSAWAGWQHKYGNELLDDIEDLLDDMARNLTENYGHCEFKYGEE